MYLVNWLISKCFIGNFFFFNHEQSFVIPINLLALLQGCYVSAPVGCSVGLRLDLEEFPASKFTLTELWSIRMITFYLGFTLSFRFLRFFFFYFLELYVL